MTIKAKIVEIKKYGIHNALINGKIKLMGSALEEEIRKQFKKKSHKSTCFFYPIES